MGYAELQSALARLCTDPTLRSKVRDDPEGFAQILSLDANDLRMLERFAFPQVEAFARGLIAKRRGEVADLLPLTCRALGHDRLRSLFARHAERYQPTGVKKHLDDALAFAEYLRRSSIAEPRWLRDLVRFESDGLLMSSGRRRLAIRAFAYPVHEIARELHQGRDVVVDRPAPTLVMLVRWRTGGPVRRWILKV